MSPSSSPPPPRWSRPGKGYVLCSIGQESGEIPYTAYFAAAERSPETTPDVIQRFTNAVAQGPGLGAGAHGGGDRRRHRPQFPDSDLSVLTAVTQRHLDIDAWNAVPRMEQAALERLETVMEGAGELTREQWVDYSAIVDNTFADAAVK